MSNSELLGAIAEALEVNAGQRGRPFNIGMEMAQSWVRLLAAINAQPGEVMPALHALMVETDDWVTIGMLRRRILELRPTRTYVEAHEADVETGPPMTIEEKDRFWEERIEAAKESGDLRKVLFAREMLSNGRSQGRMGGYDGRPEMKRLGDFQ